MELPLSTREILNLLPHIRLLRHPSAPRSITLVEPSLLPHPLRVRILLHVLLARLIIDFQVLYLVVRTPHLNQLGRYTIPLVTYIPSHC